MDIKVSTSGFRPVNLGSVSRRVRQLPGGGALLESLWPFRNGAVPAV